MSRNRTRRRRPRGVLRGGELVRHLPGARADCPAVAHPQKRGGEAATVPDDTPCHPLTSKTLVDRVRTSGGPGRNRAGPLESARADAGVTNYYAPLNDTAKEDTPAVEGGSGSALQEGEEEAREREDAGAASAPGRSASPAHCASAAGGSGASSSACVELAGEGPGDALHLVAIVEPLSRSSHRLASLLIALRAALGVRVTLLLAREFSKALVQQLTPICDEELCI